MSRMTAGPTTVQLCETCHRAFAYDVKNNEHEPWPHNQALSDGVMCAKSTWQGIIDAAGSCYVCHKIDAYAKRKGIYRDMSVKSFIDEPRVFWSKHNIGSTQFLEVSHKDTPEYSRKSRVAWGGAMITRFAVRVLSTSVTSDNPLWTTSDHVSFEARAKYLKNRMQDCLNRHQECRTTRPFQPTRLIEILAKGTGSYTVHLKCKVQRSSLAALLPRYATLSYCWGEVSTMQLKTTSQNLTQHMQSIPWINLALTHQDAIRVAYALGIRYIWIDALCIIQGDESDWEKEAAQMATIYSCSALTIAATGSVDANGGLFLDAVEPCLTSQTNPSFSDVLFRNDSRMDDVRGYPLYERGWVFQELLLSTRIVHFAPQQFHWYCRHHMVGEDEIVHDETGYGLPSLQLVNRQDEWHVLANSYSKARFTNTGDRLAALAGVIQWFQQRRDRLSMLGLWNESICTDLAWYMYREPGRVRQVQKSPIPNLPSWTWLSWDCTVRWATWMHRKDDFECVSLLRILDCNIEWTGEPLTSAPRTSRFQVAGFLTTIDFGKGIPKSGFAGIRGWKTNAHYLDGLEHTVGLQGPADVLTLKLDNGIDAMYILTFLIVKSINTGVIGDQVYKRIGIGYMRRNDGMQANAIQSYILSNLTILELV